ncbi:MAG: hypothetical protein WC574_05010 [Candidatus Omnitrophota bacterium]
MPIMNSIYQSLAQKDWISFSFPDIIKKIICFIFIVICIGLPVNNIFNFLIIFIAGLVLVSSEVKCSFKQLAIILIIPVSVFFLKEILPRAALQEGHNVFLVNDEVGVLEKELNPEVFSFMKQQFLSRYPLETIASRKEAKENDFWLFKPFSYIKRLFINDKKLDEKVTSKDKEIQLPGSLFAFSADSLYSKPKYSRIVDEIDFNNLTEFRGAFVNSLDYNWYGSAKIKRESMPYFVMYELTPASVDSILCWTGYVLWESGQGGFNTIYNQNKNCRKITEKDIGKKIFGIGIYNSDQLGFWGRFNQLKLKLKDYFSAKKSNISLAGDKQAQLSMHLVLSPVLKLSSIVRIILELLCVFFILRLAVKINRKRFILAASIIAIAVLIAYFYCPELFGKYYIYEGGEDGVTHETFGRNILNYALSGDWKSVFRGEEDIFWNTPGFRYFRAFEKLLFGDTNLGYLAVVLLLPYVLFGFLTNFISKQWAFCSTLVFLLGFLPFHILDNLGATYYIYLTVVRGGWPDVLAFTSFLGGLALAIRYGDLRNGGNLWYGFLAHFLFFVTVFMRPQFCVAVLIGVLYFAFRAFKKGMIKEVFFAWVVFLPVLFPLVHNYYFGGKICLFTGAIYFAVDTPPPVYFNAAKELLLFNFSGQNLEKVILHLKVMIGPLYRAVFLGIVFYTAFLKRKITPNLRLLAVLCLSLHFTNLFIFATYFRYSLLAWALTVIVAVSLFWQTFIGKRITDQGYC